MKAVRFNGAGKPASIADVPRPRPGPGQVLVKIGGAGVCHSDLHVMDHDFGLGSSFTLGHENAGWIAGLGQGVGGLREGEPVAVYGPWGCGRCHACQVSAEN
jgi:alcohol dehydrogenase, propanol-preferring